MFEQCCKGSLSPRQDENEHEHLNPIHRRISNRKQHFKVNRTDQKQTKPTTKQPIIKNCDISTLNYTLINYSAVDAQFVHSLWVPIERTNQKIGKAPQLPSNKGILQSHTIKKSSSPIKKCELHYKYIDVLEKTNNFLEKQLQRSRSTLHRTRVSTSDRHGRSRFSSELHHLRERLNSIDLSNIKKLAMLGQGHSTKPQRVKPIANKESTPSLTYSLQ